MADSDLFNKPTKYAEIYPEEIVLRDDKSSEMISMYHEIDYLT
jgi:hypothetical protein